MIKDLAKNRFNTLNIEMNINPFFIFKFINYAKLLEIITHIINSAIASNMINASSPARGINSEGGLGRRTYFIKIIPLRENSPSLGSMVDRQGMKLKES